jgi:hypothetical protein
MITANFRAKATTAFLWLVRFFMPLAQFFRCWPGPDFTRQSKLLAAS